MITLTSFSIFPNLLNCSGVLIFRDIVTSV
nr:MAG TPA: hypothetical protein [Caudoviricetes sp.]